MARPGHAAQNGVDQSGRAALAGAARELHGIIDDRGGWDPIQVRQLVSAHSQDLDDFGVEALQRPFRKPFDDVVERRQPA